MQYGSMDKKGFDGCEQHDHSESSYSYKTSCEDREGVFYMIHKSWNGYTDCTSESYNWYNEEVVEFGNCSFVNTTCQHGISPAGTNSYKTSCEVHSNGDNNLTYMSWNNLTSCPDNVEPDWTFIEKIDQCNNYGQVSRYGACEMPISSNLPHVIFFNKTTYGGCETSGDNANKLFEVWFKPNECFYFDHGDDKNYGGRYSMYVFLNSTYVSPREYNSTDCDELTETWREDYKIGECMDSTMRRSIFSFSPHSTNGRRDIESGIFGGDTTAMFVGLGIVGAWSSLYLILILGIPLVFIAVSILSLLIMTVMGGGSGFKKNNNNDEFELLIK